MEDIWCDAKGLHRTSDLVRGDEAVVDVEGSIFYSLGHHRPGELLKLQRKVELLGVDLALRPAGAPTEQQSELKEIKRRGIDARIGALGSSNGLFNELPVARGVLSTIIN